VIVPFTGSLVTLRVDLPPFLEHHRQAAHIPPDSSAASPTPMASSPLSMTRTRRPTTNAPPPHPISPPPPASLSQTMGSPISSTRSPSPATSPTGPFAHRPSRPRYRRPRLEKRGLAPFSERRDRNASLSRSLETGVPSFIGAPLVTAATNRHTQQSASFDPGHLTLSVCRGRNSSA
jgi:hypothetical protein